MEKRPKGNKDRPSNYNLESIQKPKNIEYPISIKDVSKYESLNNCAINIYCLDEENKLYPLAISKTSFEKHIDMLLISNEITQHYVYISNLHRLVSKQISKHKDTHIICKKCLYQTVYSRSISKRR
eukprot:Lithocolla_globosa_v1_NODE_118_length_6146_cov_16.773600.p3 type:complete len:126 gc:universal NODE_118_length_6146_cov_16.773600:2203-2580(+)